jgi:hypothetical protein
MSYPACRVGLCCDRFEFAAAVAAPRAAAEPEPFQHKGVCNETNLDPQSPPACTIRWGHFAA